MQLRKALDVASKDLLRWFRSRLVWGLMFGAPLMITGLLYIAFGGLGRSDAQPSVSATRLCVANLDRPSVEMPGFAGGQALVEYLQQGQFSSLLEVTLAPDEASARQAVDSGHADLAIIIPNEFTDRAMSAGGAVGIVLYQDPTLSVAPAIAKALVSHFLDGFFGSGIANEVVLEQFTRRGLQPSAEQLRDAAFSYAAWTRSIDQVLADAEHSPVRFVSRPKQIEPPNQLAELAGRVLAGQLIFFSFFTAASAAQNIIEEEEQRTLARLFTTPTPRSTILAGKFLAGGLLTLGQVLLLALLARAIFGIRWGQPGSFALVVIAQVVGATGLGLFLVSLVKTTQQAGVVFGLVLTVLGMAGGLFTVGVETMPAIFQTAAMLTPQGWALRAWKMALQGVGPSDLAQPVLVLLVVGAASFIAGALSFRRRLA